MIVLSAKIAHSGVTATEPFLARCTDNSELPRALAKKQFLVLHDNSPAPPGFLGYLSFGQDARGPVGSQLVSAPVTVSHLSEGDVIRINPAKSEIRVLYRRGSNQNYLLVTERCNNYCVMCSQPPKPANDDYIMDELFELIPLVDPNTVELGITGGEPTLLGERLFSFLRHIRCYLPRTAVHMLSNGRRFQESAFASAFAKAIPKDFMVGIPIYGDEANLHDFVVQAHGAFDETVLGILNLKRFGVRVEIRVVLQKGVVERLPEIAEFIRRNLLFVDRVALMGLETIGFARANIDQIWADPIDYGDQLKKAVVKLDSARIRTSIYNHQLCVLPKELWRFSVKSISDWKNEYLDACRVCTRLGDCGGVFSSSPFRLSRGIKPFLEPIHSFVDNRVVPVGVAEPLLSDGCL